MIWLDASRPDAPGTGVHHLGGLSGHRAAMLGACVRLCAALRSVKPSDCKQGRLPQQLQGWTVREGARTRPLPTAPLLLCLS